MEIRKHLLPLLATILFISNIYVMGNLISTTDTVIENQQIIADNQVLLSQQLEAMMEYQDKIIGESLETDATDVEFDIHLKVWQYRDGVPIMYSEHAGAMTNIGLDWVETMLGNNDTDPSAQWISLTTNNTLPDGTCTQLTPELAANNLSRAQGAYASAGTGSWTITYTFTASGASTVEVVGLNWMAGGDNNLFAYDDIASAAMQASDTLEVEWTITAS